MTEARKLAAILVSDIVGFSRLAGADEDRILARLRTLRSDLIDPTISVHRGRVVKRTGDGSIVEFRSVVDAVRCGIEIQQGLVERNAGLPPERRIEFRVGIHLGDVVEESDGDLMGDGVNIAARLEGIARPGAICLSEDAYRQVKGRLDLSVSDLGHTELKNIAEPIRVYSLEVGAGAQASPAPSAPAPDKSAPPRMSMVVLPFASLGGDAQHEHFVDGVTESLTTDLSRIANAFVVARNTAFTYKGKPVDAKQLGRDLNVRYILEGSIQHGGSRMRINAQLIDAATGNHMWADRFDKPIADLFDMQDEIVSHLANQLRPELLAAEALRAEREANPDSVDLYFQGVQWFNKGSLPNIERAREYFERAVALDPTNVDALVGVARVDVLMGAFYTNDERPERHGGGRGAPDQGALHCAEELLGASLAGICPNPDQSRRPRHWRIGPLPGAEPKPRRRACVERPGENRHGPRGGDRGSYPRGVPYFAGRRGHLHLELHLGPRQAASRRRRGSDRDVSPLDRRQPQLPDELFRQRRGSRPFGAP